MIMMLAGSGWIQNANNNDEEEMEGGSSKHNDKNIIIIIIPDYVGQVRYVRLESSWIIVMISSISISAIVRVRKVNVMTTYS